MQGAFQTGAVATNWPFDKVLHGMWELLRTRLREGTPPPPLPALNIFLSVFVKAVGLKMKMWLQRLLKFGLILYK